MKIQIPTSHTTHDQNGTPIYSNRMLCKIVSENFDIKSYGKVADHDTIYATTNATIFNEKCVRHIPGLAPENIIRHDNNRLARGEGRCTLKAFCQALHLSHFDCNASAIYRFLNDIDPKLLENGSKNFVHCPTENPEKRTVTETFTRTVGELEADSWTVGETADLLLDFNDDEPQFLKATLLAEQLLDIACEVGERIRNASKDDTEESICNELLGEVLTFLQINTEVK